VKQTALIIPAAGTGSRMNRDLPKPYIEIAGKSILWHTLKCFGNIEAISEVVLAVSDEYEEKARQIASELFPAKNVFVVRGGNERQDSIRNALKTLDDSIELVIIHDAVRPFVSRNIIETCMQKAVEVGASIVAVPAKDTIKKVDDSGMIDCTPERKELWQAQTPQVFLKEIIIKAYRHAAETGYTGTDDASLVEKAGDRVTVVEGDRENFKITYPVDMKLAELLIEKGMQ